MLCDVCVCVCVHACVRVCEREREGERANTDLKAISSSSKEKR